MNRVFPSAIDNSFRGQWPALVLFGLFLALKLLMSVNSILNAETVITGADGIPLESYGAGAAAVVSLFRLLALGQFMFVVLGVIALVRYRAMIPLLFLIFLAEHLGRRALLALYPIDRPDGTPVGFYINLGLAGVLVIGFLLSIWGKKT